MGLRLAIAFLLLMCAGAMPSSVVGQTKNVWVPPRSGIWNLKGADDAGIQWTAKVRLARTAKKGGIQRYRGSFNWVSADGNASGREYFTGRFDRRSGLLRLKSSRVVAEKGDLGLGNYVGFGRSKGRRIVGGKWYGADVVPGTWRAAWVRPL